jgi:hypothetical protein
MKEIREQERPASSITEESAQSVDSTLVTDTADWEKDSFMRITSIPYQWARANTVGHRYRACTWGRVWGTGVVTESVV